jgi:GntR family transcriptional regulator
MDNNQNQYETPSFSPLYRQIKSLMLARLSAGEWAAGGMIPSEAELAQRFNVSQGTVRKAIDEMAAENLLVRQQGKGTFVASHDDPRSFFRFLRLTSDRNEVVPARSVPLSCSSEKASAEVARVLKLKPKAAVIHLQRLLQFGQTPVVLDDIWLHGELFAALNLEMLQAWEHSLYSLFETQFGVRMVRAEERLRAVAAEPYAAQLLSVSAGSPLLSVERTAFTYDDRPVEWRKGLYLTTNHHYLNDLG